MEEGKVNNKKIVKNTLFLYIRMLFVMFISLYTSRVILKELGVSDYGIYSVVGGFVSMFGMISTSLSGAISRYINVSLGIKNKEDIQKVFSAAVHIQLLISIIILLFGETFFVWFLNTKMTIPIERLDIANWVLQFSLITFVINVLCVPYNALLIAHEHMSTFAIVGIFEAIFNLFAVILLQFCGGDKLFIYSLSMLILAFLVRIFYVLYCRHNFVDCKFSFSFDKNFFRNILEFAGWNFIGVTSGVLRDQGINLLLNIFCGPIVNAARGVATQVNAAVAKFSSNFMVATKPQITKSCAAGNFEDCFLLTYRSSKFSFFLLVLLCMPILIGADFILGLWLVEVPMYSSIFVKLILLLSLIESFSFSLITLLLANGRIRNYQIIVGGIQLLNFPIAYLLLFLGVNPAYTIVCVMCTSVICLFVRLYILREQMNFPSLDFVLNVVLRGFFVFVLVFVIVYFFYKGLENTVINFLLMLLLSELLLFVLIFFIGMTIEEKNIVKKYIVKAKNKILK